jgi:histone acetyltransferase 1
MNKEDTQGTVAVASDDEEDEQVSRDTVVSPDEKDGDSDYLLTEEEESEEPNCANAGTTRTRRMPVDEIMERCGKALPTRVQHLNEDDFLKEPIGTILHEYQRNKLRFVISLADGCNAVEYHNQVQTLATWFIETADTVNVASRDGGYWKVLYLFRRNAPHQYSLAGYLTIFHFLSPFKRPKSGIVARVCQALILPPYQRMGHGKMLLKTVYELAADSSKNIVEINVEDPAPSFVALRNGVDIPRIHAQQKSVARYHLHDSRRSRRGLFSRSCRQGCHCGWSRGTHYAATSANLPRTLQTVPREQS